MNELSIAGLIKPSWSFVSRHHTAREEIQAFQLSRIKGMVKYAYESVPLYRRKYDAAGIQPQDIRTMEDFKKLPLLTKEELQSGFPHEILSARVDRKDCYVVSTSGHSGSPIKLYRKKAELNMIPAAYLLGRLWIPALIKRLTGVETGRRITTILPRDESYDLYRAVEAFRKVPLCLRHNLQYLATETYPDEQLQAIQQHRPDTIISDLTALKNIVNHARLNGQDIPPVKLLFIGSELIDRHSRKMLATAFNARIIEHYGSEEAGTMAFECPAGEGLHIAWCSNYLEILKDGKEAPANTPGEVVVTNLLNLATPIIRYSGLGDTATAGAAPCNCRARAPLLKMIDGRMVDAFVLSGGRTVHPFSLTIPMEHICNVQHYQIRQEERDLVKVLVVISDRHAETQSSEQELQQRIASGLKEILGDCVHIKVVVVDAIPQPAGSRYKARPVISLVKRHPEE